MCSFCVVPFTRGRERSRNPQTIIKECKELLEQVDEKYYYKLKGKFDESQHGWCMKEGLSVS